MDPRKFSLEILRTILRLVLVENRPIDLNNYLHQANFGLLETCWEMRDESRAIYYSDNTFGSFRNTTADEDGLTPTAVGQKHH